MRGSTKRLLAVSALLACSSPNAATPNQGGGAADAAACSMLAGTYEPSYAAKSGDCGPIDPRIVLPINGGPAGLQALIVNLPDARVATDVSIQGCTLHLSQTVTTPDGVLIMQLDGKALTIHSAELITGIVSVTRFDTNGQRTCNGTYEATFTRQSSPVAH